MRDGAPHPEGLGLYVSVPFCRAKCSYCNFASGVFAESRMQAYVDRLCAEIAGAGARATAMQAVLPQRVESIFFGGGTPSLLAPRHLRQIFFAIHKHFEVAEDAEITMECAPGQIADTVWMEMLAQGTNRISFGVQSFVDAEAAAVGRKHTAEIVQAEIERVRSAGVRFINVDLIAGLPHQTAASWRHSLDAAVASGAGHISVYMLEVDEDSRLGREVLAGGVRYHAHFIPDEELTADLYLAACEHLERAGVLQYEISNFARAGEESRHNLRYWLRQPYLGLGLDAHSMLRREDAETPAVRFANTDDLDRYIGGESVFAALAAKVVPEFVTEHAATEERVFLGLRLNAGMERRELAACTGEDVLLELEAEGMLVFVAGRVRLSARGRLLSNEVFARLLEAVPA
ncbi:MAG TPA: radical SAM family heme chaperone HemW [Acidobacteriaceae bacterium]|jgi:oxygen-independent coproporphyrinogen-3 oxidase|nr:radical SAM family heme chaperone HemW [Acidobacteriaceae bacterium]